MNFIKRSQFQAADRLDSFRHRRSFVDRRSLGGGEQLGKKLARLTIGRRQDLLTVLASLVLDKRFDKTLSQGLIRGG